MTLELKEALHKAITSAIRQVGVEQFKKTSLFLSNQRRAAELKRAA